MEKTWRAKLLEPPAAVEATLGDVQVPTRLVSAARRIAACGQARKKKGFRASRVLGLQGRCIPHWEVIDGKDDAAATDPSVRFNDAELVDN
eukprot:1860770-Pyramimonas_sp.AAC.1